MRIVWGGPLQLLGAARAAEVFREALDAGAARDRGALMRYVFDTLSYQLPDDFAALDLTRREEAEGFLSGLFTRAIGEKVALLADEELFVRFQNICFLKSIDVAWIEQVDFLEQLKTVVRDRNMAQHRVEYEYRREAYFAFEQMKKRIHREIVRLLCLSRIERGPDGGLLIQFA